MGKPGNRIAEYFAEESSGYSQLILQGHPNVYLLNATENSINKNLRLFEIGQPTSQRDHKIIILMGATGSGKSTLIEGMVNHILGVLWKDLFRFKCIREDESASRNQAHSQTSSVTAYTIHHQEGMAVPYSITIIDTPGYGDTRGVERDKEITKNIHQFLIQENIGFEKIHAACFVAASGNSRLTVTQRYILDSVLSIFGKDFKDSIRLLVTFADNAEPPVVEACYAACFPMNSSSSGIMYCKFNSSVLYAYNRGEKASCFDELFWDMGQENFRKFFTMLEGMNGKDLRSTREVIKQRQQLEQSLKHIESELEGYFVKIDRYVENKTMCPTKVSCENGFLAYNCHQCQETCGEPVYQGEVDCIRSPCARPTCKCPAENHEYEPFVWRTMKFNTQSHELRQMKANVIDLLRQVSASGRFLDSAALRSNALTPADYLQLMRIRVAEEQKPGYLTRLETLTELQQLLDAATPSKPPASSVSVVRRLLHRLFSFISDNPPASPASDVKSTGLLFKNIPDTKSLSSKSNEKDNSYCRHLFVRCLHKLIHHLYRLIWFVWRLVYRLYRRVF